MLVTVATIALRCSAESSAGFFAASWYHDIVNPCSGNVMSPLLNEKTTSTSSGT